MLTPHPPHHLPAPGLGPVAPRPARQLMLALCIAPPAPLTVIWPPADPHGHMGTWAHGHMATPSRANLQLVKPVRYAEHIIGQW
jgi:hypothetical protein